MGHRAHAMEDADIEQVLENDVKHRNEIAYDFVDVVRATAFLVLTFPSISVTSPNLILSGWISGSKGMTFRKFSLALAMGWSNSASTSVFTSSSKNVVLDFVGKAPSNWDANVSSFCRSH